MVSEMGTGKQYDEEFKKQAIKLAKEIGNKAAADEHFQGNAWNVAEKGTER